MRLVRRPSEAGLRVTRGFGSLRSNPNRGEIRRIPSEGPSRKRYATRAQRRLRSIFRRFGLDLFNRSGILFVQDIPESLMGRQEHFQALQRLWITGHEKSRFDLARLFLLIANVEQTERDGVEGAVASRSS